MPERFHSFAFVFIDGIHGRISLLQSKIEIHSTHAQHTDTKTKCETIRNLFNEFVYMHSTQYLSVFAATPSIPSPPTQTTLPLFFSINFTSTHTHATFHYYFEAIFLYCFPYYSNVYDRAIVACVCVCAAYASIDYYYYNTMAQDTEICANAIERTPSALLHEMEFILCLSFFNFFFYFWLHGSRLPSHWIGQDDGSGEWE